MAFTDMRAARFTLGIAVAALMAAGAHSARDLDETVDEQTRSNSKLPDCNLLISEAGWHAFSTVYHVKQGGMVGVFPKSVLELMVIYDPDTSPMPKLRDVAGFKRMRNSRMREHALMYTGRWPHIATGSMGPKIGTAELARPFVGIKLDGAVTRFFVAVPHDLMTADRPYLGKGASELKDAFGYEPDERYDTSGSAILIQIGNAPTLTLRASKFVIEGPTPLKIRGKEYYNGNKKPVPAVLYSRSFGTFTKWPSELHDAFRTDPDYQLEYNENLKAFDKYLANAQALGGDQLSIRIVDRGQIVFEETYSGFASAQQMWLRGIRHLNKNIHNYKCYGA